MASLSSSWLIRDGIVPGITHDTGFDTVRSSKWLFKKPFLGVFHSRKIKLLVGPNRTSGLPRVIKCAIKDGKFDPSSIEPPPYSSYMDSTSGQLEPASGARSSIPGKEYWPEGTMDRVRAARAPEPVGKSEGKPSYGKNPGSRRKQYKEKAAASETVDTSTDKTDDFPVLETYDDASDELRDPSDEYVTYQTEPKEEDLTPYELDRKIGRPHPFIDPSKVKPIEEPRSSEDLWWNWRKPDKEQWSRWQRRRPDVDTVSQGNSVNNLV